MSANKKTLQEIQQESDKSFQAFEEKLKKAREYQENNSVVKKTYGGYVIDLGTNYPSYSKKYKSTI